MTKQNHGFTIVDLTDEEAFKAEIMHLLNEGWKLHGNMIALPFEEPVGVHTKTVVRFIQALTITKETINQKFSISSGNDEETDIYGDPK